MKLPRAELLEVTRRVSQLAQRNAALRLSFSEGELVVSAETPDLGDAREALPAPYSGELLEIGFNPEFVRDGLESIDADEVVREADLPAAARAAGAGRRRRLQLPGDADPAQRLSAARAWSPRSNAAGSATSPTRETELGAGHRRPARPERRPARRNLLEARLLRPHRPLLPRAAATAT